MPKYESKVERYGGADELYRMEFECKEGWEPMSVVFLKQISQPPEPHGYVYESGEYTVVYRREVVDV